MSDFGKRLIESAEQALAIAKGEMEPAAIHVVETPDVAVIRKRQKLSQGAFAQRYGLSVSAVRDWEQRRRNPDRAAAAYLTVIDREPEAVIRALATS
ncbi:MAG: helix-turn-helix domain-containing protein [Paracoccus sp. (in: a-proteobacteria)]|nr:helix-turn-helix domain-containing protein [Paracoccus sp. (in: a-proteobacteria)]